MLRHLDRRRGQEDRHRALFLEHLCGNVPPAAIARDFLRARIPNPDDCTSDELKCYLLALYVCLCTPDVDKHTVDLRLIRGTLLARVQSIPLEWIDDEHLCEALVMYPILDALGFEHPGGSTWLERLRMRRAAKYEVARSRWQGFVCVHVVYVLTGFFRAQPLDACEDEIALIRKDLRFRVRMHDVELVGHYVHCLKMLGMRVPQYALAFLTSMPYDGDFHHTWCIRAATRVPVHAIGRRVPPARPDRPDYDFLAELVRRFGGLGERS
jgi:hypothetical protein